jgi:hypothetical protein
MRATYHAGSGSAQPPPGERYGRFRALGLPGPAEGVYNSIVPEISDPSPQVIVTLIHGTFAPRAAWTRPGSPLRERLADHFRVPIEFEHFDWTGRNTNAARRSAAEGLSRRLAEVHRRAPSTPHFLLAHSHGGNVALYALGLATPEVRASVAGVITLGTSFIVAVRREIEAAVEVLPSLLLSVGLLVFLAVFLAALFSGIDLVDSPLKVTVLLWCLAALIGAFSWSFWAVKNAVENLVERIRRRQAALAEHLTAWWKTEPPLLAITASADEAFYGLRLFDRIGDAPFTLYARCLGLTKALFGTTEPAVTGVRLLEPLLRLSPPIALFILLPLLVLIAATLVAGVVTVLFPALLISLPLVRKAIYFDHAPLDYLHTRLLVGRWPVRRSAPQSGPVPWSTLLDYMGAPKSDGLDYLPPAHLEVCSAASSERSYLIQYAPPVPVWRRPRLLHSAVYGDPEVLDHIATWMTRRQGDRGGAVASQVGEDAPSGV